MNPVQSYFMSTFWRYTKHWGVVHEFKSIPAFSSAVNSVPFFFSKSTRSLTLPLYLTPPLPYSLSLFRTSMSAPYALRLRVLCNKCSRMLVRACMRVHEPNKNTAIGVCCMPHTHLREETVDRIYCIYSVGRVVWGVNFPAQNFRYQ